MNASGGGGRRRSGEPVPPPCYRRRSAWGDRDVWPFRGKACSQPTQLADPPEWMVEEVRRRTDLPLPVCRETLQRTTVEEYQRIVAAQTPIEYQTGTCGTTDQNGLRHDPIEDDPAFAAILLRASLEAEREVGAHGDYGHCLVFWECKKRILRKRYSVAWRDEAELNPDWEFD